MLGFSKPAGPDFVGIQSIFEDKSKPQLHLNGKFPSFLSHIFLSGLWALSDFDNGIFGPPLFFRIVISLRFVFLKEATLLKSADLCYHLLLQFSRNEWKRFGLIPEMLE